MIIDVNQQYQKISKVGINLLQDNYDEARVALRDMVVYNYFPIDIASNDLKLNF